MSRLSLEKDDDGVRVTVRDAVPHLVRQASADGERIELRIEVDGAALIAQLTPAALQTLGLQCVALMPQLAPQYTVAGSEDAYRLPARLIRELDDRSIQILLRECQSDTLIDFLWYMKDVALLKLVLRNLSQRAAEMMMDDLDVRWRGKNPDATLEANARRGRDAVREIMDIVRRLIAASAIDDVLGEGQ